jgi:hypothetical protein
VEMVLKMGMHDHGCCDGFMFDILSVNELPLFSAHRLC